MSIQGFNKTYYLNKKLAQLQASEETRQEWEGKTAADLEATLQSDFGLTAEQHYTQYGVQENLNPSPYFDTGFYLQTKLAQLQEDSATASEWQGKTTADVLQAFSDSGLSPLEHYAAYSREEGLAPSSYFNPAEYVDAKAQQMLDTQPGAYADLAAAREAFLNAWEGDLLQHYVQYGAQEGVNPSSSFDTNAYLQTKLDALQEDPATADEWADKTLEDVANAFAESGLSPLEHFLTFGEEENLAPTPVTPPEDSNGDEEGEEEGEEEDDGPTSPGTPPPADSTFRVAEDATLTEDEGTFKIDAKAVDQKKVVIEANATLTADVATLAAFNAAGYSVTGKGNVAVDASVDPQAAVTLKVALDGGSLAFNFDQNDYTLALAADSSISLGGGTLNVSGGTLDVSNIGNAGDFSGVENVVINSGLAVSVSQLEQIKSVTTNPESSSILTPVIKTADDVEKLVEALKGKFTPGSQPQVNVQVRPADGQSAEDINSAVKDAAQDIANSAGTAVTITDSNNEKTPAAPEYTLEQALALDEDLPSAFNISDVVFDNTFETLGKAAEVGTKAYDILDQALNQPNDDDQGEELITKLKELFVYTVDTNGVAVNAEIIVDEALAAFYATNTDDIVGKLDAFTIKDEMANFFEFFGAEGNRTAEIENDIQEMIGKAANVVVTDDLTGAQYNALINEGLTVDSLIVKGVVTFNVLEALAAASYGVEDPGANQLPANYNVADNVADSAAALGTAPGDSSINGVLVNASAVSLTGTEGSTDLDQFSDLLAELEGIAGFDLKNLDLLVTGTDQNETFTASTSAVVGQSLNLDGGAGNDVLNATLTEANDFPAYAPTISGVETIKLNAVAANEGATGLMFTRVTGAEKIVNTSAMHNLTVVDVANPVTLVADTAGSQNNAGSAFVVRYSNDDTAGTEQQVELVGSNLAEFVVTALDSNFQAVSAGIETLDVLLSGENTVGSFTTAIDPEGVSLSDSVTTINLDNVEDTESSLKLNDVWDGLTIDMSDLKGQGSNGIDLDLSGAQVNYNESVVVKVAEFDAVANNKSDLVGLAYKSDQTVKLPELSDILGTLVIENMTIASGSEANSNLVVNDVLDFSATENLTAASLASLIETVSVSNQDNGYATLTVDFTGSGELQLTNVISQSLADVFIGNEESEVSGETITDEGVLSDAAVTLLIGIMVQEGTFTGITSSDVG